MKRLAEYLTGCRTVPAARRRAGVTLTELMIAVSIITIGVIGGMGSFAYINRAITQSRLKTIASNLAQEQMEVLKNKTYYQLLVTTNSATSSGFNPNFNYDLENYPPLVITLWGIPPLTRRVNIDYVAVNGSEVAVLPYTSSDPGMKRVSVYVTWEDAGTPKKVQFDSYYENPSVAVMSSGFSGTVTNISGGAPIGDALVQVQDSPKWRAYTNASGVYTFQVVPGTYTLVCSSDVFFPEYSASLSVADGAYTTADFSVTKIATGSVSGMAYLRNHLVISQIVASTIMVSGVDIEYIELYNPTTGPINISDGAGGNNIEVRYYGESGAGQDVDEFLLTYISTFVGSGRYYLISNSSPLTVGGGSPVIDALYAEGNGTGFGGKCNWDAVTGMDCIRTGKAGAIRIKDNDGDVIDTIGWSHGSAGKLPTVYEGNYQSNWNGFPGNTQIMRDTGYQWLGSNTGRAYDAGNNSMDCMWLGLSYQPYGTNSGVITNSLTGTPAAGARVTVNDGLSTSVQANATGFFYIPCAATSTVRGSTNTFTVTITSASYAVYNSSARVVIAANANKNVGTIITTVPVSGGIAQGFVYGDGPNYNRRLGNPTIRVGSQGVYVNTDSQGYYELSLPTGAVTITANYSSFNGSYQPTDANVTITPGEITLVPDFHLPQGGTITGYVTSGIAALPNVVVQAAQSVWTYEDTTDTSGRFYIYVTTSSAYQPYTLSANLDAAQSYTTSPLSPLTTSVITPGSTVFAGTITVSGAMGTLAGVVTNSGNVITTGVLIVASTGTIADPLPAIYASSVAASEVLYFVSSTAQGTYSLDVRSSTNTAYNMRAFYPVVNTDSGAVATTSKSYAAVWVSTAGASVTRSFSWP